MGCGSSKKAGRPLPEHYTKVEATPGGTITRTRGCAIDTKLPRKTPRGTVISPGSRRDYQLDPLTFAEVTAIEQARERARRLASTPIGLGSAWKKIVLPAETPTGSCSVRSDGGGDRELTIALPPEASAGDELVVETPRGTLVDVVVPSGIAKNSSMVLTVGYHSLPRGGTPPSPADSDIVTLLCPPDLPSRRRERQAQSRTNMLTDEQG